MMAAVLAAWTAGPKARHVADSKALPLVGQKVPHWAVWMAVKSVLQTAARMADSLAASKADL